ncbi:MAG: 4Fe-4S dicluster domain-containing protein [Spirochaetaceae bacterium]|nr:4Fe-4S dicluster domain-containing protein [Spirochaetaceae bacterium]
MNKSELLKEQVQRNSGVNVLKCMRCGKCSATCPNYDVMEYHPHQFVNMVENNQVELLMKSESLYMCLTCFACVERCPRGVEPGKLVEAIRLEAVRIKENNHLKPDQIVKKLTDKMPQQAIVTAFRKYTK